MTKMLLKPAEVGEALGLGRSRVYELLAGGELPSVKIGGSRRVPVEALKEWIAENTTGPSTGEKEGT